MTLGLNNVGSSFNNGHSAARRSKVMEELGQRPIRIYKPKPVVGLRTLPSP
jgi:hypothetical protein